MTETLGYDGLISVYRLDGGMEGNTFVHDGRITDRIGEGRYNLADPFSDDPEHLEAIEYSSLREEQDFGGDYLGGRFALEGSGFAIGGRNAAWTAGVEMERVDVHDILVFRANDGTTSDVSEVLGSGGTSYAGDRNTVAGFGEMSLPLAENLDVRIAGRGDEADDVGTRWRPGASGPSSGPATSSRFVAHGAQDNGRPGCDISTAPSRRIIHISIATPGAGPPPAPAPSSTPCR